MTPSEYESARRCADAVAKHPIASALLSGGETELELRWRFMDRDCGGRLDYLGRALRRLCDVFGVSIAWLLGMSHTGPQHERDVVIRVGNRPRLAFPGLGISEELLSPSPSSPLELLISTFEPGADSDDYSHEGDEAGLVIDGTLDLWVDGVHHILNKGDSFAFPSTTPHRCANHGKKPVKVLWVITPPHY